MAHHHNAAYLQSMEHRDTIEVDDDTARHSGWSGPMASPGSPRAGHGGHAGPIVLGRTAGRPDVAGGSGGRGGFMCSMMLLKKVPEFFGD
jgi:hypothetical protein